MADEPEKETWDYEKFVQCYDEIADERRSSHLDRGGVRTPESLRAWYQGAAYGADWATLREFASRWCPRAAGLMRLGDLNRHGAEALAFTPDGSHLVSGEGNTVSVWSDAQLVRRGECAGHNIHVLAISPDGARVALGGDEPAVRVCEVATMREVAMLSVERCVRSLVWTRDGRRLHVLDRGKRVSLWEVGGAELDAGFDGPEDIAADAEDRVLVGAVNLELRVRDQAGGASRTIGTDLTLGLTRIAVTPDARLVAAGSLEGEVAVYDLATGRMRWRSGLHDDPIEALRFSMDGRVLAAGNATEGPSRNNVALWNVESGEYDRRWRVHDGFFNDLALRPDGKRLATCSGIEIEVWEI